MEEQLRTLVQMQKLDDRIGALRVLQKELPQQLNEIIGHVDQATANLLACETERAELAKKQRSLESDIKQHQEQIKKYSNQLSEIKTNKEYKALNSEIAFLKEKISEQESHQLELMDAENQAAARVNEAKQELDKAEKAKSEQEGELRRQIDSLEGQIEDLRAHESVVQFHRSYGMRPSGPVMGALISLPVDAWPVSSCHRHCHSRASRRISRPMS